MDKNGDGMKEIVLNEKVFVEVKNFLESNFGFQIVSVLKQDGLESFVVVPGGTDVNNVGAVEKKIETCWGIRVGSDITKDIFYGSYDSAVSACVDWRKDSAYHIDLIKRVDVIGETVIVDF